MEVIRIGRATSRIVPGAAAPACLAIARDEAVGDEVRLSAAELLAALGSSV